MDATDLVHTETRKRRKRQLINVEPGSWNPRIQLAVVSPDAGPPPPPNNGPYSSERVMLRVRDRGMSAEGNTDDNGT